jgi:prepilin-type N-terminal cleavage/methylation domain-containing protein
MTLIEMLVVVAILGVVLAALTDLFVSATHTSKVQTDHAGAQQDARLALDKFRREFRCASGASGATSTPGPTVTVTLPSYCSKAPSTTLSGSVTLPVGTITVASTAKFNTGTNTLDFGSSTASSVTCTGTSAGTSFTGCSGGTGTYSGTKIVSPVTWCATGASRPYSLIRYVGPTSGPTCTGSSSSSAVTWLKSLQSNAVFSYNRASPVSAPALQAAPNLGTLGAGNYAYDVTAVLTDPFGSCSGVEVSGTIARATVTTSSNKFTLSGWTYTGPGSPCLYNVYGRDDGSTTSAGLRFLGATASSLFVDWGPPPSPGTVTADLTKAPPLATVSVALSITKVVGAASRQFSVSDDIDLRNSLRF